MCERETQLADSFSNRNYKYFPTKTIHEHFSAALLLFFFSFICGFTVFDSVSQWSVPSSGDSAVRVVGDRTQFCFGALLLLYYREYAPVSTTGGQRRVGAGSGGAWGQLTGYGQEHGHSSKGTPARAHHHGDASLQ